MTKYVYFFGGTADGRADMKNLLGGKGANLAEMTNIGLPVPAGFTLTTEVCNYYYANDHSYPPELEEQVAEALRKTEAAMGAKFGDPKNPLLRHGGGVRDPAGPRPDRQGRSPLDRTPGRAVAPRTSRARGRCPGRRVGGVGAGHGRRPANEWSPVSTRPSRRSTTSSAPSCRRRAVRMSPPARSPVSPGTTLGRQGRNFIAAAPTEEDIAAFTGGDALTPVRAYVGAPDGIDLRETAERAVDELDRMGGFDRSVLNVVTGTGRGWVNENQARALEFMWAGDTATVSIQYSYLPSWMSFLVDGERAQDAGRLLFDAVYARWVDLPRDARPLLVVSGESLGSFGGEAAFSGDQDLATRTDGALFVGPTNNNRLWSRFTGERDAGTPEVLPVYDGGAIVRFADVPADWTAPGEWGGARIGYLQHANDPITWWDWSLALNRPDWLEEDPGRDVSTHVQWIPVVTMLQLAADQLVANDVPAGQGHQFGQEPARAWAEILPPPGWTAEDTERLVTSVRSRSTQE